MENLGKSCKILQKSCNGNRNPFQWVSIGMLVTVYILCEQSWYLYSLLHRSAMLFHGLQEKSLHLKCSSPRRRSAQDMLPRSYPGTAPVLWDPWPLSLFMFIWQMLTQCSLSCKHTLLPGNHNFWKWGVLFSTEPGQFQWLSGTNLQQCKMHKCLNTGLSIFSNLVLTKPFLV